MSSPGSTGHAREFDSEVLFQHLPLHQDCFEIRLLRLARPRDHQDPVQVHIEHAALSALPQYTALSYTWGRPSDDWPQHWDDCAFVKAISINGRRFYVRANLYYALQVLRLRLVDGCCLWIDAICIDQTNIQERNEQVRRMSDIYAGSTMSIVWLGPDDYHTPISFFKMKALSESWLRRPQALQVYEVDEAQRLVYHQFVDEDFGDEDVTQLWESILSTMARTWWQRAWIVQEVCLPKNVVFLSETSCLAWSEMVNFRRAVLQHSGNLSATSRNNLAVAKALVGILNTSSLQRLHKLNLLRNQLISSPHDRRCQDLLTNLVQLRPSQASNANDKVYAALGMCKASNLVSVDYNTSTARTYTQAAWASIVETESLAVLGHCRFHLGLADLPTWAPDWSVASDDREPLLKQHCTLDGRVGAMPIYTTGGAHEEVDATYFEEHAILGLRGTIFDGLCFVASCDSRGATSEQVVDPVRLSDDDMLKVEQQRDAAHQREVDKIYECTWLVELVKDPRFAAEEYPLIDFGAWSYDSTCSAKQFEQPRYKLTDESLLEAYWRTLTTDVYFDLSAECEKRLSEDVSLADWMTAPTIRLSGRKLAITATGLLCLVPEEAVYGDSLAIVQGSEVPFILRSTEQNRFQLIGECYAHGIMDGQIFDALKQNGELGMLLLT